MPISLNCQLNSTHKKYPFRRFHSHLLTNLASQPGKMEVKDTGEKLYLQKGQNLTKILSEFQKENGKPIYDMSIM